MLGCFSLQLDCFLWLDNFRFVMGGKFQARQQRYIAVVQTLVNVNCDCVSIKSIFSMYFEVFHKHKTPFLSRRLADKGFTVLGRCEQTKLPSVGMTVLVERPYLQQNPDTLQGVMMALIEGMLYTGHPRNKPVVLETLTKQFRLTDSTAAEGAYQDVATLVRLEEGRKPYVSLEGMRILQRLLAPQNPKIGSLKIENLIDSSIMKRIDDSGFFEKMAAEYGGK